MRCKLLINSEISNVGIGCFDGYGYLYLMKTTPITPSILKTLLRKGFTTLVRSMNATENHLFWIPAEVTLEECQNRNKDSSPERNCVSIEECLREGIALGGEIIYSENLGLE